MRKEIRLVWLLVILVLFAGKTVGAQTVVREYRMKQAGSDLGTIQIELSVENDETHLNTLVKYPSLNTEIATNYTFVGEEFPKKPYKYNFSIIQGGVLDLEMVWNDTTAYTVFQLGQTNTIPINNVLALDNNVISDYMVSTWIFDGGKDEIQESSLVLPVQILQSDQPIPMKIAYIEEEQIGAYLTEHYQVNVGVLIDIWVDIKDRSLIKLNIPMQAYEITMIGLDEEPELERVFKDFGGFDFKEKIVEVKTNGAVISGTLSIPHVPMSLKLPAAVIAAGSGPTDRDGNSYVMPGAADYLKEIAHYLASRGIVVLRFDKRGVGESKGLPTSFNDYINDIDYLVEHLKDYDFIDSSRVYLIGHSEGAWLVSEVAAKRQDLAGIVLLSGAGYPFFDTVKRQLLTQTEAAVAEGYFDQGLTERTERALTDMYDAVMSGTAYELSDYSLPTEIEQVILSFISQRELIKDWLTADPAAVLSQVQLPVLIIQGTADIQIQVEDARNLASTLPESQRELHIVEGLDHVLKMTEGVPLSYTDPERRVDGQLLQILGNWITNITQSEFPGV